MTKAQLEKLLGVSLDEGKDTYTDDEVFELINTSQSNLRSELSKNKELVSKRNSEIAEFKRKEADKMTDEEKTNQKIADLESQVVTYQKTIAKSNKVSEYMGIGYPKDLAEKIADAELDGKSTVSLHKQFITAREESIKAELLKDTKKANTNNEPPVVTKEQYQKMTYSQKMALKEKSPEVFEEVSKKETE